MSDSEINKSKIQQITQYLKIKSRNFSKIKKDPAYNLLKRLLHNKENKNKYDR
jgi:hypothetical protein